LTQPPPEIPDLAKLPLVIETPHLRLRPLEATDIDAVYALASEPDVARLMSWRAHTNRDESRAFVESVLEARAQAQTIMWAIEHAGVFAGCVGLHGITWTFRAWRIDRAELGYWLGKPFWGKGLMSEAARAATRFAFEVLRLHKITIGCIEGNHASQRIIEKLGYRFLALHIEDVWRDGQWWDHRRYEMLASEWLGRPDAARGASW
jgi:ribosomal-protein-alanine N-acetyltransferase